MIYSGTRVGKFQVGRALLDDGFGPLIYEGMVPVEVRMAWIFDGFEVTALSERFDPVDQGCEAPFYDLQMIGETVDEETGRLGNWKPVFTRRENGRPADRYVRGTWGAPSDDLEFRLKIYPNPMRSDVFIAEDREIAPYPGIVNIDGKPVYPSVPCGRRLGVSIDPAFGVELVRRWNAHAPPLRPGFVD